MKQFSIIVCTYNPDAAIFHRLLAAIRSFGDDLQQCEVILVDNNSNPAVGSNSVVANFLQTVSQSSLIIEKNAGLTSARTAGIKAAKHNWLIFFDDDNEPAADYLQKLDGTIKEFPQVGCWGPGEISVEYTGQAENAEWLENSKDIFQEKKVAATAFDNKKHWQDCYPYGTGMAIRKEIATEYVSRIQRKQYSLSDRKGKSLSSGGDVQIVFTGIHMGFSAGTIAGLQLTHLINAAKANPQYIRKVIYGTASAYVKAYAEVYNDNAIQSRPATNLSIAKTWYATWKIHFNRRQQFNYWKILSQRMGETNAHHMAVSEHKPILLKIFEKMIHV